MYKCEHCQETSQPNTPAHKVTIKTERTIYPLREKVFTCWKLEPNGRRRLTHPNDPGGAGSRIVRELTVCAACAKRFNQQNG